MRPFPGRIIRIRLDEILVQSYRGFPRVIRRASHESQHPISRAEASIPNGLKKLDKESGRLETDFTNGLRQLV